MQPILFVSIPHSTENYLTMADLKKLYIAMFDARTKWRNILLFLGVSPDTIDRIGMQWQDDPDDCYREGLKKWLKNGEKSWKDVVEALSSPTVGYSGLARTIERDYPQSAALSSPIVGYSGLARTIERDYPQSAALSSPIVGYSGLGRTIERDYPQSAGAIYPKSDGKY